MAVAEIGAGHDFRFGGRFGLSPAVAVLQTVGDGTRHTWRNRDVPSPNDPRSVHLTPGFLWY